MADRPYRKNARLASGADHSDGAVGQVPEELVERTVSTAIHITQMKVAPDTVLKQRVSRLVRDTMKDMNRVDRPRRRGWREWVSHVREWFGRSEN